MINFNLLTYEILYVVEFNNEQKVFEEGNKDKGSILLMLSHAVS